MEKSVGQQLGDDEWVAREAERDRGRLASSGLPARLSRTVAASDLRVRLLVVLGLASALPLVVHDPYLLRVAGLTGLYVLLALGLNVVAGLAGLLDLGYIAFYGLGAYTYALLASPQFGLHLPSLLLLPLAATVTALFGLLLGLPSLRLRGDYLAIVTLGFGQVASLLYVNLDRVSVPFLAGGASLNITGGPNGVINVDDLSFFGLKVQSIAGYYYLILLFAAAVYVAVHHLDRSRIGRAWRAIREDELAAQTMGVDSRRYKLLAFSVGAAIAGVAGALFAAWQGSVFPPNFDVSVLIIIYAMVVLGGIGSLPGAVLGAVILAVLPEVLRSPESARLIFYLALIGGIVRLAGSWRRGAALLVGVVALGLSIKIALTALAPAWFVQPALSLAAARSPLAPLSAAVNAWMLFPRHGQQVGNIAFVLTLVGLLGLSQMNKRLRRVALAPALYALAFVWEVRLVQEPAVTRMLILGALLVLLMSLRPNGLLGQRWMQRL